MSCSPKQWSLERIKPVYLRPNNLKPSPCWQMAERHFHNRREDYWKNRCSIDPDASACKIFDE